MRLSPRFTKKDWQPAFDVGDWGAAIDIVEDRIRGRWLDAARLLLDDPRTGLGFAILALDCVIIESMWGDEWRADTAWQG